MQRHFPHSGGSFNQLANCCYQKKVTENTVANSLAACLTFDQLSCKFENIGGLGAPMPPSAHSCHYWNVYLTFQLYSLGGLRANFIMTELYLQDNMLTDINDTIQQLTCLQVLLLHGNQLAKLTDVMHEIRSMQNLKVLSMCQFNSIIFHLQFLNLKN